MDAYVDVWNNEIVDLQGFRYTFNAEKETADCVLKNF